MPLNYWAESLNFITPWQKLFHHSPIYTNLKVFGCSCYPLLRPYTKHKLEPKTKKNKSLLAIAWTTRVKDVWIQLLEKHFFLDMLCLMKNPFHSSPLHWSPYSESHTHGNFPLSNWLLPSNHSKSSPLPSSPFNHTTPFSLLGTVTYISFSIFSSLSHLHTFYNSYATQSCTKQKTLKINTSTVTNKVI